MDNSIFNRRRGLILVFLILLLLVTYLGFTRLPKSSSTIAIPTPTPSPSANKVIIGQNENYAVYLIDPTTSDSITQSDQVEVIDKTDDTSIKISGLIKISDSAVISDNGNGQYLAISTGTTDSSRTAIIISLIDKTLINKEFCMIGQPMLW